MFMTGREVSERAAYVTEKARADAAEAELAALRETAREVLDSDVALSCARSSNMDVGGATDEQVRETQHRADRALGSLRAALTAPAAPEHKASEREVVADAQPFDRELRALINKHSRENGSDTPDFILTAFLMQSLAAFDHATKSRSEWYAPPVEASEMDMDAAGPATPPTTSAQRVPHAATTDAVLAKLRAMTPDEALATFVAAGTHNADGSLTATYGGDAQRGGDALGEWLLKLCSVEHAHGHSVGQRADAILARVGPPPSPARDDGAPLHCDALATCMRSRGHDGPCISPDDVRGSPADRNYLRGVVTLARAEPSLPVESVMYQAGVPGRVGDAEHEAAYALGHPSGPPPSPAFTEADLDAHVESAAVAFLAAWDNDGDVLGARCDLRSAIDRAQFARRLPDRAGHVFFAEADLIKVATKARETTLDAVEWIAKEAARTVRHNADEDPYITARSNMGLLVAAYVAERGAR
jgi:hypothetical protein